VGDFFSHHLIGESTVSHHPVEDSNTSSNPSFQSVLDTLVSRRSVLRSGATVATLSAATGLSLLGSGCSSSDSNPLTGSGVMLPARLGFEAVAKSLEDRITLPAGYSARVLFALGDPLVDGIAEYANDGSDDGNWDRRAGDHHDAMAYYPFPKGSGSSSEGLLAINHEALTDDYLHVAGPTDTAGVRPLAEVVKEQFAHGVAVIKVRQEGGVWSVDRSASQNKRWHVNSEMQISGPARGSALLTTQLSPMGGVSFGTLNNCGHGYTPWGTYLSGEENWFAYFKLDDSASDSPELTRYGIVSTRTGFNYRGWDTPTDGGDLQKRFNASRTGASAAEDFRNEPNHFGYCVEIDPYDPSVTPKKRTALGRFSHEGAWFAPAVSGQPLVVYMGDDARGEYIYKFVSAENWNPADASGGLEIGDKYLDRGTLYVAKFNDDSSGEWLELSTTNPLLFDFSAAEIAVYTRQAADALGATRMDRPEWGTVSPITGEVFLTLTNNVLSNRPVSAVDAANPRAYTDTRSAQGSFISAATQTGNPNGHIIRWREAGGRGDARSFSWDIFLFGAEAGADSSNVNVSQLTAENDFSSPDGLWADSRGILWIQTDDGAFTDVSNCMMLAAIPGTVSDGEVKSITSTVGADSKTVNSPVGKVLGTDQLARFLVGTPGCEITGVDMTPDNRTMFVNVQHPGERGNLTSFQSHWPLGSNGADATVVNTSPTARPRSATIVITRDDGGEIGV
jgi:uncharacterized protein